MISNLTKYSLAALVLVCLNACSERNFRHVQICLGGPQYLQEFEHTLRALALDEGLDFKNTSEQIERDFQGIQSLDPNFEFVSPVFNVAANNGKGFWMVAGNTGLSNTEISIGFTGGRDRPKAIEISNRIVNELSTKWDVFEVAPGMGAFPLEDCE